MIIIIYILSPYQWIVNILRWILFTEMDAAATFIIAAPLLLEGRQGAGSIF